MEWRVKPEPSVATVRMKPVVIAAACLESKTQAAAMARARTAYSVHHSFALARSSLLVHQTRPVVLYYPPGNSHPQPEELEAEILLPDLGRERERRARVTESLLPSPERLGEHFHSL
ncbi:hypothetical protein E2C01_038931 [Portunus trituberculatus]|uniref:Uncharacterized protein n=1 Tax=Portunus trituberculatus TaxID=210409 RepID=A0A5B7FJU2_PORTR|nr:hypothetical protein [Portunus trituberculatus]